MQPARVGVRRRAVDGLYFLGHVALSTLGVGVAAAALTYSVVLSLHPFFPSLGVRADWILTETPYFPVQIVVGLVWGFRLGRRYQHRVMLWTWVVPALAIVSLILFVPLRSAEVSGGELTKTEHFFGWGCLPQNHCFDWSLTVLLLLRRLFHWGLRSVDVASPCSPIQLTQSRRQRSVFGQ
jgi:hypothetical protein